MDDTLSLTRFAPSSAADRGNRDLSYAMPAEGPDPWDNDQYTVLYFMLCNSDLLDK